MLGLGSGIGLGWLWLWLEVMTRMFWERGGGEWQEDEGGNSGQYSMIGSSSSRQAFSIEGNLSTLDKPSRWRR